MTMPHLMNCPHMDDGHCLDCVKAAWEASDALRDFVRDIAEHGLRCDTNPTVNSGDPAAYPNYIARIDRIMRDRANDVLL